MRGWESCFSTLMKITVLSSRNVGQITILPTLSCPIRLAFNSNCVIFILLIVSYTKIGLYLAPVCSSCPCTELFAVLITSPARAAAKETTATQASN